MFEERMEEWRRAGDKTEVWAAVRRGWCLGEEAFRKELLAQVSERRGGHPDGAELQEGQEAKAEGLVKEELGPRKGQEAELGRRRKTDWRKVRIALRLGRKTTLRLAWIAWRLQMGSVDTLKNRLRLATSPYPVPRCTRSDRF